VGGGGLGKVLGFFECARGGGAWGKKRIEDIAKIQKAHALVCLSRKPVGVRRGRRAKTIGGWGAT